MTVSSNVFCIDIEFYISTSFTQIQQSFVARYFWKTDYERHNPKFKKLESYELLPLAFHQLKTRT
jgi:hypothetical protein